MPLVKTNWVSAASTTGPTGSEEVTGSTSYALTVEAAGSPDGLGTVELQGSVDGSSWVTLLSVGVSTNTGPETDWVADRPVKLIRLNVTAVTGDPPYSISASALAV